MTGALARNIVLAALAALAAAPQAWPQQVPGRGQLLYDTHCIECHTTQMHWREGRKAQDWLSLKAQVGHWQARAVLQWSEADVTEVARYLNETIYRFPQTTDRVGSLH